MKRCMRLAFAFVVLALAAPVADADNGRFQAFTLPSGDYPHDVAPGPNGTVYYADQRNGGLGIVDPKTGKVEKVKFGGDSAPHGVIAGPGESAWLTDGGLNAIVSRSEE